MPVPGLAAAVAPAAVSALGSLIGGIFGSKSQESINERNIEMQRETNAQNYKMFQEQLAYNTDQWNKTNQWNLNMWNMQNAYNDPKEQVRRLLQAGINPAFGNGVQSTAASSLSATPQSAPSPSPAQSPVIQPYDFAPVLNNAVIAAQNSINAYYQNKLVGKQSEKIDAERERLSSVTPYELKLLENQAKSEGWKGDIARQELIYLQAVNGQRISQQFGQTRLLEKQLRQADESVFQTQLMNKLYQVELSWKDKMSEREFNLIGHKINEVRANIALTAAREDLTLEQKKTQVQETLDRKLGNDMKKVDKEFYREFKDVSLSELEAQEAASYWNAQSQAKRFRLGDYLDKIPGQTFDGKSYINYNTHRHRQHHFTHDGQRIYVP